jgi:hypothetical protein
MPVMTLRHNIIQIQIRPPGMKAKRSLQSNSQHSKSIRGDENIQPPSGLAKSNQGKRNAGGMPLMTSNAAA